MMIFSADKKPLTTVAALRENKTRDGGRAVFCPPFPERRGDASATVRDGRDGPKLNPPMKGIHA